MVIEAQTSAVIDGRYKINKHLGRGGMGEVFEVFDLLTNEVLALKKVTIPADEIISPSESEEISAQVILAKEFKTMAALRHPNIVSVLDYGFDGDEQPYFTMELLNNAQTINEAAKNLLFDEKIDLVIQVLQALIYLHRRGVIHRDLKPANVLVVGGKVKVLDFGLSLFSKRSVVESAHQIGGTLSYMAPEIFEEDKASKAGDLYAVGMIAYEVFTGVYPFNKSNFAVLLDEIVNKTPDMNIFGENVLLAQVVAKLLIKEREKRYKDANLVLMDLCAAVGKSIPKETFEIRESFLQAAMFVGRQKELSLLGEALTQAIDGKGSSWLVGGESGIGKSRLLDEVRILALVEDMTVLQGQSVDGGGIPYQIWRIVVRRLVLEITVGNLEASILKEIIPDISKLLGREIPDAPKLEAEASQQRLSLTISELFKRHNKPMLLLLEDLQWAGESIEPLKHLVQISAELPLLIVCDFRDDEKPNLPEIIPQAELIKLRRFSEDEILELSIAMLGKSGDSKELRDFLYIETEGNIFFLIEVLRELAEQAGGLGDIGKVDLPEEILAEGIDSVLKHRLQRIPPWANSLLQLSAIAGRNIDKKVIASLAEQVLDKYSLDQWLLVCSEAAVIEMVNDRWCFNHEKLQKHILSTLPGKLKASQFTKVAKVYEQFYKNNGDYSAKLAWLWRKSGNQEKEWGYALTAGELFFDLCDYNEAVDHFSRVLSIVPKTDLESQWRAVSGRDQAYLLLGEFAKRNKDDDLLVKISKELNEPSRMAEAYFRKGYARVFQGNEKEAKRWFEKGIELAHKAKNLSLEADLLSLKSISEIRLGDFENAKKTAEEALKRGKESGDELTLLNTLTNVAVTFNELGDYSKAVKLFVRQAELNSQLGNKVADLRSLVNLGYTYLLLGLYDLAEETTIKAIQLSKTIVAKKTTNYAKLNLGLIYSFKGDPEQAKDNIESAIKELVEMGDQFGEAAGNSYLGLAVELEGDFRNAKGYFEKAIKIFQDLSIPGNMIDAQAGLLRCMLKADSEYSNDEYAKEIWEYLENNGGTGLEFPVLVYLTCVDTYTRLGDMETAKVVLKACYNELTSKANRISDVIWRKSFMENVPAHRELIKKWEEHNKS